MRGHREVTLPIVIKIDGKINIHGFYHGMGNLASGWDIEKKLRTK